MSTRSSRKLAATKLASEKPPPARVARPVHPLLQKLSAFVGKYKLGWLIASAIIALLGIAQPVNYSDTFQGTELTGKISSGRWSLVITTPTNTGELTFFSEVPGFKPESPEQTSGKIYRVQSLTSAHWDWSHDGDGGLIWNANAAANWSVSAHNPVTVVVEYDSSSGFIFYLVSFVCVFFWLMALAAPSVEKYFERFNKRPERKTTTALKQK